MFLGHQTPWGEVFCKSITTNFQIYCLCLYFQVSNYFNCQGSFCTWAFELLSTVLVQQVITASQDPWVVVVCPKALKDFPVKGIVVLQRESMKKLEKGLWKDKVLGVHHPECGHWQNLLHPQKLGILQKGKPRKGCWNQNNHVLAQEHVCLHVSLTIFFEASKVNLVVALFINLSLLKNKGRKMNGNKRLLWDSRPLSDEMDFLRLMDWVRSGWGSVLKSSTTPTLTEKNNVWMRNSFKRRCF